MLFQLLGERVHLANDMSCQFRCLRSAYWATPVEDSRICKRTCYWLVGSACAGRPDGSCSDQVGFNVDLAMRRLGVRADAVCGGEQFASAGLVVHHQRAHAFEPGRSRHATCAAVDRGLIVFPYLRYAVPFDGAHRQVDGEGRALAGARAFGPNTSAVKFDQMLDKRESKSYSAS